MKPLLILITVTITLFAASKLNQAYETDRYKTPVEIIKIAEKLGR